jgi:hypothetical protein
VRGVEIALVEGPEGSQLDRGAEDFLPGAHDDRRLPRARREHVDQVHRLLVSIKYLHRQSSLPFNDC